MNQTGGTAGPARHHHRIPMGATGCIPSHGTDRKYRERDDEISGTALIDIITLITRFRRHNGDDLARADDPQARNERNYAGNAQFVGKPMPISG